MKTLTKSVFAIASIVFFTMPQASQAREFVDVYKQCGLGAMIAPKDPLIAVFTNVTWDLGTTAVSSDMSSAENCKGGKARVASFINQSYDNLEQELASGNGKYLDTLASMTGNKSSKTQFVSSLRSDFAQVVASVEYSKLSKVQKAEKLYNMIYKA